MITILLSFLGALAFFSADRQAAANSLPQDAFAPPAVTCEQPANTTAAPAPGSEADIDSMMRQFMLHKEVTSQMESWWQERTDLHDRMAEQSPSATQEATAQMEAWWRHRTGRGYVAADKPAPNAHHRHHRQASTWKIEYGCPPSVCTNH